jgi:aspartyl-tRNA(Asn)/glutamyl-tRNA(Gln) amidotransferase subunit A
MALPAYYVLASAEASSNLGRFGGGWFGSSTEREIREDETGEQRRRRVRTEGFGREVKKRILAGTHALSAE